MSGAVPPFPNTPTWRGAQLKHRDNFTFYLYLTCENMLVSGGIIPRILNLRTRWRGVATFTLRPLYLRGKSSVPIDRNWLGGPQSRSGEEGKSHHCHR
jgi:hypothetical protein